MHHTHDPATRPLLVLVLAVVAAFFLPGCQRHASEEASPNAAAGATGAGSR